MKSPTLAAIMNFLLPGSAYLYLKQRIVFGWMVLIAELLFWFLPLPQIIDRAVDESVRNLQIAEWLPLFAALLLYQFAFAVDAYRSAKTASH